MTIYGVEIGRRPRRKCPPESWRFFLCQFLIPSSVPRVAATTAPTGSRTPRAARSRPPSASPSTDTDSGEEDTRYTYLPTPSEFSDDATVGVLFLLPCSVAVGPRTACPTWSEGRTWARSWRGLRPSSTTTDFNATRSDLYKGCLSSGEDLNF